MCVYMLCPLATVFTRRSEDITQESALPFHLTEAGSVLFLLLLSAQGYLALHLPTCFPGSDSQLPVGMC